MFPWRPKKARTSPCRTGCIENIANICQRAQMNDRKIKMVDTLVDCRDASLIREVSKELLPWSLKLTVFRLLVCRIFWLMTPLYVYLKQTPAWRNILRQLRMSQWRALRGRKRTKVETHTEASWWSLLCYWQFALILSTTIEGSVRIETSVTVRELMVTNCMHEREHLCFGH